MQENDKGQVDKNSPETEPSTAAKPKKNDEDFESSMARLADLAAKELAPKNPPKDDLEIGSGKKKKKKKLKWYQKALGKGSVSIRLSYVAASGIIALIGGIGVACLPKLFEIMETQREIEFAMKAPPPVVRYTDDRPKKNSKKKIYSLTDVASDIGGTKALSEKSFREFTKDVSATSLMESFSTTARDLMDGMPGNSQKIAPLQTALLGSESSYESSVDIKYTVLSGERTKDAESNAEAVVEQAAFSNYLRWLFNDDGIEESPYCETPPTPPLSR